MHILNAGRGAFLEFLRNLTPQVLMLSLIFIWSRQFNFRELDIGNAWNTIVFFLFVAVFALAAIANSLHFMDSALSSTDWLETEAARIRTEEVTLWQRLLMLAKTITLKKPVLLIEMIVAMLVVQIGLLAMITSGILSAVRLLTQ